MVEILTNKLYEFQKKYKVPLWDIKEQADILLAIIEEKKMLPPTIKNPEIPSDWNVFTYATNKAYHELHNTKVELPKYEINEWNKEDEEG